ncbi:MAG: hypothetical protein VX519_00280 [Myxococcota bacterium]|nr:hypothetical protein [Myxococcota bacterium]
MPQPPLEDLEPQSTEVDASADDTRTEQQTDAEDALFAWRATYEQRRGVKRFKRWSRYGMRVVATGSVALLALFLIRAPSTEPEASPVESNPEGAQILADEQGSLEEEAQPQEATTWDIGVIDGSLMVWSKDSTEWVQFDYAIQEKVYLQWLDANGVAALNAMECTNKLRGGLHRCYIGRSHGRIGIALNQGMSAGTWSVQACSEPEGGVCMPIGTFAVNAGHLNASD